MPIPIMQSRYEGLQQAVAGLQSAGAPLVASNGKTFFPAATEDDAGSLYFVPKLTLLLHGDLNAAITIFYGGMIALALVCGLAGAILYCKSAAGRTFACVLITLLSLLAYRIGDIYIASFAAPLLVAPLFLYFLRREKFDAAFGAFLFAAGFAVNLSGWIRAQAGLPVLLFVLIMLGFGWRNLTKCKVIAVSCLFVGFLLPHLFFTQQIRQRDAFFTQAQISTPNTPNQHLLWHSIYIGLGYLPNNFGIIYKDECAAAKVRSIDPTVVYCSQGYEAILRRETLKFVRQHPGFVLKTLAIKFAATLKYFLLAANFGLLALPRARLPRPLLAAFAVALAVGSLPGLLVVPNAAYLLGFITFAALFGIVSVANATGKKDSMKNDAVRSGNTDVRD